MNKSDMIQGDRYRVKDGKVVYTYVDDVDRSHGHGNFRDVTRNGITAFKFSIMEPCTRPKVEPEFEFDEEIEVSYYEHFSIKHTGMFQCDFRKSRAHIARGFNSNFCVIDANGKLQHGEFARKIEPTVTVCINGQYREIPKSLAEKILMGDVNER
tara:strand:- start:206 stop:670 length:465 start_codon:yes stop_codon:yes gene_type:complete